MFMFQIHKSPPRMCTQIASTKFPGEILSSLPATPSSLKHSEPSFFGQPFPEVFSSNKVDRLLRTVEEMGLTMFGDNGVMLLWCQMSVLNSAGRAYSSTQHCCMITTHGKLSGVADRVKNRPWASNMSSVIDIVVADQRPADGHPRPQLCRVSTHHKTYTHTPSLSPINLDQNQWLVDLQVRWQTLGWLQDFPSSYDIHSR